MISKLNVGLNASLLIGITLLTACGEQEPPQGTPIRFKQPTSSAELSFQTPEGWVAETPASEMRRDQFRLPGDNGQDAEMAVFVFPGSGGGTQANIDRWIGQFSTADGAPAEGRVESRKIAGLNVSVVDVTGTYTAGGMAPGSDTAPRPNYRMLAAVVETSGDPWFLKLTGPRATVDRWEESFFAYLESVQVNNGSQAG